MCVCVVGADGANFFKMKNKCLLFTLAFCTFIVSSGRCQVVDTLIDVGGYRLHFHIVKGTELPILFEGGSGADVTVWDTILKPVADV